MKRALLLLAVGLTLALWGQAVVPVYAQEADSGVIRLGGKRTADPEPVEQQSSDSEQHFGGARRGFDYDAFRARLETYWFQRKAFLDVIAASSAAFSSPAFLMLPYLLFRPALSSPSKEMISSTVEV